MQVVHFHQSGSGGVIHATHNRRVDTRRQVYDDRRFTRVPRSVAAVLNILDLIARDDPADDRVLPYSSRDEKEPRAIQSPSSFVTHISVFLLLMQTFGRRPTWRTREVVLFNRSPMGLLVVLRYYGATRAQPEGSVGPTVLPPRTLLFMYHITVARLLGLNSRKSG